MATPLQQASTRRKLIYAGLIFVLFTGSAFGWRGLESGLAGRLPGWSVTAQARDLDLRELDRGQTADPTGALIRLTLTGSRGLATTLMWRDAIKKQEHHEWNKLERRVYEITKLQPHFTTPWLFQSWNLAYNVSVELDEPRDKYFYIARGIDLLADGERLNRDNPDMRFWIGFYYQNKFGVSDEAATLRSLMQMSCMDPADRDPERLLMGPEPGKEAEFRRFLEENRQLRVSADKAVNPQAFAEFCRKYPQMVRRLRDYRHLSRDRKVTPVDIYKFLVNNRKIPSRYYDPAEGEATGDTRRGLKPADEQFPVLPPRTPATEKEAAPDSVLDDAFDNYMAGRAWFAYAQAPLPPPVTDLNLADDFDRRKYRMPRQPAMILFRQYPPRAISYTAERLQKEGWFDKEGWVVDEYRSDSRWFPRGQEVVAGNDKEDWGHDAWDAAYNAWKNHGEANGLYLRPEDLTYLQQQAETYRQRFADRFGAPYTLTPEQMEQERRRLSVRLGRAVTSAESEDYRRRSFIEQQPGPDLMPEEAANPDLLESFKAHRKLYARRRDLQLTNFEHFLFLSEAEREPETVRARKLLYQADQLRRNAQYKQAIARYQAALEQWKQVCAKHYSFRSDNAIQEDLYEKILPYVFRLREDSDAQQERMLAEAQLALVGQFGGLIAAGGSSPAAAVGSCYPFTASRHAAATLSPSALPPPLDDVDAAGDPWITPENVSTVRLRRNMGAPKATPPVTRESGASGPGGPMPPGGPNRVAAPTPP
jgi:hypothetical protein